MNTDTSLKTAAPKTPSEMPNVPDSYEEIRRLRARLKTLDRILGNAEEGELPERQKKQFSKDARAVREELGDLLEE